MSFFPQLSSGSITQFPFERERRLRTVINETLDGKCVTWADEDVHDIVWRLRLIHLSDSEMAALRAFFASVEGRCQTFMFPDPAANLLRWTNDLAKPVWQVDPLVQISGSVQDPFQGSAGHQVFNSGPLAGGFRQTAGVPSNYSLCLSAYLRASAPVTAVLRISSASGTLQTECKLVNEWGRYEAAGIIGGADESVTVELGLPAGAQLDVFGMQLEAQAGASAYKRSESKSGIYARTRFDSDRLVFTTHDANDHSTELRLISGVKNDE